MNYMTEFFDCPKRWTLDREKYTWLSDYDAKVLDEMPFDWGDIMCVCSYFLSNEQIKDSLLATDKQLETYCQTLWRKSWADCYRLLIMEAKKAGIDVFREYAKQGNSTAMAILGHSIMKLDEDDSQKAMKITIVNDLGD